MKIYLNKSGFLYLGFIAAFCCSSAQAAVAIYTCPTDFTKDAYARKVAYRATNATVASSYPVNCLIKSNDGCVTNGIVQTSPAGTFMGGYLDGQNYHCLYKGVEVLLTNVMNPGTCQYYTYGASSLTKLPASVHCYSSKVKVCSFFCASYHGS